MRGILFENNDIKVAGGTLVLGDNTMDVIENIIDSNKGEWKSNKFLGVGIRNMIAQSDDGLTIRNNIVENLKREEILYTDIRVSGEQINIQL